MKIKEAVVWRCSVKEMLLKISQISQGKTCVGLSFFIKLQAMDCSLKIHLQYAYTKSE